MELLASAFNLILCQPLFNALVLLYQYLPGHDFGIAIIVLTIIIRLILYPLMVQSIRSQKVLSELQPKIQEIQKKNKQNKEGQGRAMMELYKKEKINPFGGCLPLLIQLPILYALFYIFKDISPSALEKTLEKILYPFLSHPGSINTVFLGTIDLAQPCIVLAVLVGITQFFQTKMITPKAQKNKQKEGMAQFSGMMQKQMLYFFPIIIVFILLRLPAALGLYWLVTTLFSIFQQHLIFKKPKATRTSSSSSPSLT